MDSAIRRHGDGTGYIYWSFAILDGIVQMLEISLTVKYMEKKLMGRRIIYTI